MLNLSDVSSDCVALKKMFTLPDWNIALERIRSGEFRTKTTTISLSVLGQGHQCIGRYTATTVKEQEALE